MPFRGPTQKSGYYTTPELKKHKITTTPYMSSSVAKTNGWHHREHRKYMRPSRTRGPSIRQGLFLRIRGPFEESGSTKLCL